MRCVDEYAMLSSIILRAQSLFSSVRAVVGGSHDKITLQRRKGESIEMNLSGRARKSRCLPSLISLQYDKVSAKIYPFLRSGQGELTRT